MLDAMSWTWWFGWVCALGASGCGKGTKDKVGDGSATPRWQFSHFVHAPKNQLAIVTAPGHIGVLGPDGTTLTSVKTTASTESVAAVGDGATILVTYSTDAGGTAFHAIDRSGNEVWAKTLPPGSLVMGTRTFASASPTRLAIVEMSSGKHLLDAELPTAHILFRKDEGYVFSDDNELWLVDEAGKERWRQRAEGLANAAIAARPRSLFILRKDRTFEERDYRNGKAISNGTCTGNPSKTAKAINCAGEPAHDPSEGVVLALHFRSAPDGKEGVYDYFLWSPKGTSALTLVANDFVGRERWRSEWPVTSSPIEGQTVYRVESAKVVGFVAGTSVNRTMLVYDDESGALLVKRPLSSGDRFAGFAESCALIVTRASVTCVDARSGSNTWSVATTGSAINAWPRDGAEALIADGNPLALSRIAKDGQRVWQLEMPDSDEDAWAFSDVMGVATTKAGLAIVDVVKGKTAEVK